MRARIEKHLLDAATLLCVLGAPADDEEHGIPEEAAQKEERPHRIERFREFLGTWKGVDDESTVAGGEKGKEPRGEEDVTRRVLFWR